MKPEPLARLEALVNEHGVYETFEGLAEICVCNNADAALRAEPKIAESWDRILVRIERCADAIKRYSRHVGKGEKRCAKT